MADVLAPYQFSKPKEERRAASPVVLGSFLAASLLLCSCATPYKPLDHHYGYSEREVTNDVYQVTFLGNGSTSYERALDFALLRAAEIALNHQAQSFTLLDVVNLGSARPYLSAPHSYRTSAGSLRAYGPNPLPAIGLFDGVEWTYLVTEPPQQRIYYQPGVRLQVKLLPDPPGSYYPYDPAKECERLKRKYGIRSAKP